MVDRGDDRADDLAECGVGFVERLADAFANHPAFVLTQSGFEVLHADWPVYPRAHGRPALLQTLTEFQPKTQCKRPSGTA